MSKTAREIINIAAFLLFVVCCLGCGDEHKTKSQATAPADTARQTAVEPMTLPVELYGASLTLQEGLPSGTVSSVLQDATGFMWFGTHNGLVRYDGSRMTVYQHDSTATSLADSRVKAIVEDAANHHLWVRTASDAVSCLNLATRQCESYMPDYRQRHYVNMKLTAPGVMWLWGKSDGAARVSYNDGQYQTEYFDKTTIGANDVTFLDSISSTKIIFGTSNKLYLRSADGLKCVASGMRFVRSQAVGGRYLLINTKGQIFRLEGNRLTRHATIAYADDESCTSDMPLGNRWVVFTSRGAYAVSASSGAVERLTGDWDIWGGRVLTDNKGRRWVYNRSGVIYTVRDGRIVSLNLLPEGQTNYIDYERYNIVEDNLGLIWISTYGGGLYVFSNDLTQSQHFVAGADGQSPIPSNYLLRMTADRNDGVWVSAEYAGMVHLQVMNRGITRLFPGGEGQMDMSNIVRMIRKAPSGDILVATRVGNLYRYSPDMSRLKGTSHFDTNIYSMARTQSGELWLGTRGKGIYGASSAFKAGRNIFDMTSDRKGRMWIATYGDGLTMAEHIGGQWRARSFFADSLELFEARCVRTDRNGWIWLGTTGGLLAFHPDSLLRNPSHFIRYKNGMEVHDLTFDRQGRVWAAATGSGLLMVDARKSYHKPQMHLYTQSDGLINNMAQSVVEDRSGNLWISTQQGVSHLDVRSGTFENHVLDRTHMGNVYNENSAVCLDDGRIVLGGNYGLTTLTPARMRPRHGNTTVVFTATPYQNHLELDNRNDSPVIDFSTLDYSDVSNVLYSYCLDGYDHGWSAPSPVAHAAYSNLPVGHYTLRVRASYGNGVWGDESRLAITVRPPLYLSPWALLAYAVILCLVIWFVVRNMREKNALRSKIRLEQELTKYKLVFFTNIAHEFRTPLTLIRGSLEKQTRIMKANHWQQSLEKPLGIMNKSVARMLRMIDQLLEFRKMQAGKLRLSLQQTDVVLFVRNLCSTFDEAAESKNITYRVNSTEEACVLYVDRQHLDKILFNLLSNAFKYTPSGGSVTVDLTFGDRLTIRVSDTGVGIEPEKRDQLFNRFMQSSYTGESFGIGLHLTRELVAVCKGTIAYDDNPGGGSVFTVTLPTDKSVFAETDFIVENSPILSDGIIAHEPETTEDDSTASPQQSLNRKKILLIEDDNDVRDFLSAELGEYFEVQMAADGTSGLQAAKDTLPDLVISDVMMPGMNGFEVCKRLKNAFETSHIPVILLTALSTDESMLDGMESGADAYVTKPFSPQLLVARVFQLLDQREKLRQKFSKDFETVRPSLFASDLDQVFVRRIDAIIEAKLGDQSLSVDKMAEMMHMGRTMFYKKVRSVTGYTPNEYIRVMRLRRAAEMLREGGKNVSEVAYAVGFDTPYYFSICFKKQFGVPPSQYK